MGAHHYQLALLPPAFADDASDDLWERDDLWSEQPPSALLAGAVAKHPPTPMRVATILRMRLLRTQSQLGPHLLRQALCDDQMRLADIILQRLVRQARPCEMLDPRQAARREIRCRPQAGLLFQHLVGNVAYLEGKARLPVSPSA